MVGTDFYMNDYTGRRGGGAGDFVAGFLIGGAVFGALGYMLAPQVCVPLLLYIFLNPDKISLKIGTFITSK